MCFKITPALREYYNYRGVSAELERRGYGSSRPELAWANRQRLREPGKTVNDQDNLLNRAEPLKHPDSNSPSAE
jgi:hypothetical protein